MSRPPKYLVHQLQIGESTLIPWRVDAAGKRIEQRTIYNSIKQFGKRKARTFWFQPTSRGITVTRVPYRPDVRRRSGRPRLER